MTGASGSMSRLVDIEAQNLASQPPGTPHALPRQQSLQC